MFNVPIWRIDFIAEAKVNSIIFRAPTIDDAIQSVRLIFGEFIVRHQIERITKL